MIIALWIIVIIYSLLTLVLIYGWLKKAPEGRDPGGDESQVTVLIPVRNEAKNIEHLLSDLENQNYPARNFNVIVIDDNSEDETAGIVEQYSSLSKYDLSLLPLKTEPGFQGSHKKMAIGQGVLETNAELIVCTDGDCRLGSQWLSVLVDYYRRHKAFFISGPVMLEGNNGWWHGIQMIEFASLIGVGAASLKLGAPNMCNGANMAFPRHTFIELNGYEGFQHIHSGDDEFLMYKIFKKYPNRLHFLKDSRAIVRTGVKKSLSGFVNQRKRWAGKWKFHRKLAPKSLAFFIFIVNLVLLAAFIWLLQGSITIKGFAPPILVKFSVDFVFVHAVLLFFGKKVNLRDFLILELFYPFYAVFFGFFSNFGSYKWKGRRLNN